MKFIYYNKIYKIEYILSKFILEEELLLNSINYIPKKRNLPSVIDVNKNIIENEKCYKIFLNFLNIYSDISFKYILILVLNYLFILYRKK